MRPKVLRSLGPRPTATTDPSGEATHSRVGSFSWRGSSTSVASSRWGGSYAKGAQRGEPTLYEGPQATAPFRGGVPHPCSAQRGSSQLCGRPSRGAQRGCPSVCERPQAIASSLGGRPTIARRPKGCSPVCEGPQAIATPRGWRRIAHLRVGVRKTLPLISIVALRGGGSSMVNVRRLPANATLTPMLYCHVEQGCGQHR